MKIYNIKIKSILIITSILAIILLFFVCLSSNTIIMTSENYTQILKEIHDNPYDYQNKSIEMIGYIFKADDFNEKQFVIARDMLINESDSRIVGFLCEYENINDFENNEWVKAKGKIYIGDYHGAMPIVQITSLTLSDVPKQIWVFPPNKKPSVIN